jgi:hypothetical protein
LVHLCHERITRGAIRTIKVIHVVTIADAACRGDQLALKLIIMKCDILNAFGTVLEMATRGDDAVGGRVQPKCR